jgi:ankyrin repeat protein
MELIEAIRGNKPFTYIEKLINKTVDINFQDSQGYTPLNEASSQGNYKVCKLLIDNKANPNINSYNNVTPLMNASFKNHYDICKLLLDNGANVNVQTNNSKMTSLLFATKGHYKNIIKLLLIHGADPNIQNYYGNTALMFCLNYKICQLLIRYGANYNCCWLYEHLRLYINKVELFKFNIYKMTGNKPFKYYFINNILLIKLLSKSKVIYHNTGIPKSIIMLIGSYFFY